MNYNDVISKIFSFKGLGSRLGLERMNRLMELLDNPQNKLKVIHVAGTNGKGSVCRYLYSILQAQGYKVGLYSSPYFESFTEMIESNGKEIEPSELIESASDVFKQVDWMLENNEDSPGEFEIITAIAFQYFSKKQLDYVILEVGLGGKGDATNVVEKPLISVITSIDYDHIDILGDTLQKIAYHKSGIIKKNCPVVACVKDKGAFDVINQVAKSHTAPLTKVPYNEIDNVKSDLNVYSFEFQLNTYKVGMLGTHQAENAVTALTVIEQFKNMKINVSQEAIEKGLLNAKQKGRFEIIQTNPTTIIDGAHNVLGMKSLRKTMTELFKNKKILLCIGLLKDKEVDEILDIIIPIADKVVVTEPDNERKMAAHDLKTKIEAFHVPCTQFSTIKKAKEYTTTHSTGFDVILYAGSLYLIGKIRGMYIQ